MPCTMCIIQREYTLATLNRWLLDRGYMVVSCRQWNELNTQAQQWL